MCVCVSTLVLVTGSQTTSNNAETEYRLVKLTDKVKTKQSLHAYCIYYVCVPSMLYPLIATRVAIVTVFFIDPADTLSHIKGIYDSKLNLP